MTKKEKEMRYYCDICRGIREHYAHIEVREIRCVNFKLHKNIKWCRVCGERIDTGACEKAFKHTAVLCV